MVVQIRHRADPVEEPAEKKHDSIQGEDDQFKIIYEGDIVEFEVSDGDKGPQASNLTIVEKGPRKSFRNRDRY